MLKMHVEKSVEGASRIKDLGNLHYKQYERIQALRCYTKAIMLCPYNLKVMQEDLREFNQSLEACKKQVADSILDHVRVDIADSDHPNLLAKCYGNRSAVLCELNKYTECLLDIERALKLGLPSSQAAKLHKRRAKCRQKLSEIVESKPRDSHRTKSSDFKRTGEVDCQSACRLTSAEVSWSESKGRHLIASCDIEAGTVILTDNPFSAVLEQNCAVTHCSFCFKDCSFVSLPCMTCALEGYCSSECRRQAWLSYHWLECSQISWRKMATWMEVMCLRTVVAASGHDVWLHLTNWDVDDFMSGPYKSVYSLETHQGKFSSNSEEKMLKEMAARLVSHFKAPILEFSRWSSDEEEPSSDSELASRLESLFLRHLLQLRCNTHVVNSLCEEKEEEVANDLELEQPSVVKSDCEGEGELTTTVEGVVEKRLGRVLLPTASLVNHSCVPNAFFRFTGNSVQVCGTKCIKKGQEICTSYGPLIGRQKTLQRKKELSERFFFQCKCEACLGSSPELVLAEAVLEGLACPGCKRGALECGSGDDINLLPASAADIWTCCDCGLKLSSTSGKLKRNIEMKEKAEVLFDQASKTGDMELILQCHKLQGSVLHRHNAALAATSDRIAQEYATRGDFHTSCDYLKLSCASVCARYGRHSIEYGSECHKLAGVLLHSGQLKSAFEAALQAKETLGIFKGPSSTEYSEVCDMLDFLSSAM